MGALTAPARGANAQMTAPRHGPADGPASAMAIRKDPVSDMSERRWSERAFVRAEMANS
jgi:hypothetical protein